MIALHSDRFPVLQSDNADMVRVGGVGTMAQHICRIDTVVPIEASINWTILETSFALGHSHSCESQLQLCTHQDLVCVSIYASSAISSIADNNERRFKEPW